MPADHIASSMAYINWTLLAGLAVGSFAAVVAGQLGAHPTRGFTGFAALSAGIFALLASLADGDLPPAAPILGGRLDPSFNEPRHWLLVAFTILCFVYVIAVVARRRAVPLALATLGAGIAALVAAALGWGGGFPDGVPLAMQLAALALATGGVFTAMVLAHWYLVTPHLPEAPLVTLTRLLLAVVVLQVALFVAWLTAGVGSGRSPIEPLIGPWAVFVWLRLLIGLIFPLVVSWAALQTARTRSMESATGLLYIAVGSIAAGTILAAGLYFGAGLLV